MDWESVVDWLELKIPPVGQLLLHGVAIWSLARIDSGGRWTTPMHGGIATLWVAAGLALGLAAVFQFRTARTTVDPRSPDHASVVVSDGVYGWSRNPMYLALLLGLAGWAIYLAHPGGVLLLPTFVLYMNRFQILPEERALREKFGAPYEEYVSSVRRWL